MLLTAVFLACLPACEATAFTFPDPDVQPAGLPVTVFQWNSARCDTYDIPDAPARAFRDASNQVQFFSSHSITWRMTGPTLDSLHRECGIVTKSPFNPDPAAFEDNEWLSSPYALDGNSVAALVHNEYQGKRHPGQCPSQDYWKCWYNSITLATSSDGGKTFSHTPGPSHLVASSPYRYVPDEGPTGVFMPSNIIHRPALGYYALVSTEEYRAQPRGVCVIRAPNLTDPRAWRAWDGMGFNITFPNPYVDTFDPAAHICPPVSYENIGTMTSSLTYSSYLKRYVLMGMSGSEFSAGRDQPGFYYSTSVDMINWTEAKLLMPGEQMWTHQCGDGDSIAYPSVLDPNSPRRNFETIGRTANLYFTQLHYEYNSAGCYLGLNRDLIRIPIAFNKPPDCSAVVATPDVLPSQNRRLFPVTVTGATEPDGEPLTTKIITVRQDEPTTGPSDPTAPDAMRGAKSNQVLLRAERSASGNGRVYRLGVTVSDTMGGKCSTTETVAIPRGAGDSGDSYRSFG